MYFSVYLISFLVAVAKGGEQYRQQKVEEETRKNHGTLPWIVPLMLVVWTGC